ncbi:MAG: alpha/beta fold hydrolase [Thermostichales cyanobacterium BF3_bins_165]
MQTTSAPLQLHPRPWIWQGHRTEYIHAGPPTGIPLVLIHGFGASWGHWRRLIPWLAADYPVYALDLLGFGCSDKPRLSYCTQLWQAQVAAFCQEIVAAPAVLVGNSLGGYVSLSVAAHTPDLVAGLVLLNSAGSFLQPTRRPWTAQLLGSLLRQPLLCALLFLYLRQPQVIRATLSKIYVNPEAITPELVELIRRPSQDPGAMHVFISLLRGQGQGRPLAELLGQLRCPLLLLWGERDPWCDARGRSRLYHQNYDQITEHFLPSGHCPQDDTPDLVAPPLLEWLRTQPRFQAAC